jgi:hypothetical protein
MSDTDARQRRLERRRRRRERPGCIYLLHNPHTGLVKIGYTQDLDKRKRDIEMMAGAELVLLGTKPGTMSDEKALHAEFASLRVIGEWFHRHEAIEQSFRTWAALARAVEVLGRANKGTAAAAV